MVTIYDISKKTKISPATISRVLNDGPVNPKTKQRVLRAFKKFGYTLDSRAASLKKKGNGKNIGLVIPDISNPIYPLCVKTVHDSLKAQGYHLILGNSYGEPTEEREILEMMEKERVAGVILATTQGEVESHLSPIFERFLKNGTPLVFLGKKKEFLSVDSICVDNFSGTFQAINYLLKTGRKKIGFIAGGEVGGRATKERLDGYLEALKEKGIKPRPEFIVCEGEYTMEYGEKWGKVLLEKRVLDAVFCGNDLMAVGLIKAAEELNIKIPEELGVVGFDDIPLASLIKPKLTTVRIPVEKDALLACDLLLKRISGKLTENAKDILSKPELVLRESA